MHIDAMFTKILPIAASDETSCVFAKLPSPISTCVEPVGRWFEASCARRSHKQTLSYHSLGSSSGEESEGELSDDEGEDESLLHSLDPTDWKNQDHYRVLGLGKLRHAATDEQIKRAYKKKVLRHHPDKRRARGMPVKEGDDDYFTCITRAIEVLGVPAKRRAYDSVDPEFDDSIPTQGPEVRDNFFAVFGPVFGRNARWSNKSRARVPTLGDERATYDEVDRFYSFWYDFDSWREYSYLDEEDKDKGENREERRWIEKQNRVERVKRKKEEVSRVRELVDNAYACDPRIARFKDEEKAKKEAHKAAKREAARVKAEEEERVKREAEEEARRKREEEEEEQKRQAAVAKKERDALKGLMKKERKILRARCKEFDYFTEDADERVAHMQDVEKLAELLSLANLQDLTSQLAADDATVSHEAFHAAVRNMRTAEQAEMQRLAEAGQKRAQEAGRESGVGKSAWPDEELQLLIKAVNLFPAGTVQRWETIAIHLSQHCEGSNRSAKEVLFKAKEIEKMDMSAIKKATNDKAFDKFKQSHKVTESAAQGGPSQRFDSAAEQQIGETGSNPAPWAADEQKLLEQAMRTYPASTENRWDVIAETIPNRSKKDCMKRYKELVEMVKAKKAAAAAKK